MNRRITHREKIGYESEKLAVKILEDEKFSNVEWPQRAYGSFDIVTEKNHAKYYIDVKSSTSNIHRLPVHDHSLVDLINVAEKMMQLH